MKKRIVFTLLTTAICSSSLLAQRSNPAYDAELQQWISKRIAYLKSTDGWLNLAGLLWLQPGNNSFGNSQENKIVFPANFPFATAGELIWNATQVSLQLKPGVAATVNEKAFTQGIVFDAKKGISSVVKMGDWQFTIIQRGDKTGIRLRQLNHPAVAAFHGTERFATDTTYKVQATLMKPAFPKTIAISNVLGQTNEQPLAGTLLFTLHGQSYSLQALTEGDELFILFADATNGESTYGAGRFLYAPMPDANGKTVLDFNKAINPPCAFTPFATCPLPPKQNQLTIAIEAGEKDYGHH